MRSTTAPRSWPAPSPSCCRPRPPPVSCRTSRPSRRSLLERTALFYLCTPANPQGAVADLDYLRRAVRLARRHGFVLAVDECYSELWDTRPAAGRARGGTGRGWPLRRRGRLPLAQQAVECRRPALRLRRRRCRSPGPPAALRAYASPVQPLPLLAAATALWQDEAHVEDNRARYRAKFDTAQRRLGNRFGFYRPAGGFFLWLDVGDGEAACRRLWCEGGIRVLPGGYLSVGAQGVERRLRLYPRGAGRRAGADRHRAGPPRRRVGSRMNPYQGETDGRVDR